MCPPRRGEYSGGTARDAPLQGADAEGRPPFDRCLPEDRRWGLADPRLVATPDALSGGAAGDLIRSAPFS
jgi:hypothetical protein